MFLFPYGSSSTANPAPVIYTVRNLIRDALQEIGALGEKQPLQADAGQRALRYLRAMVRARQADRLHLYTVKRNTFVLTSGTATYSVGPTGAFVMARPLHGVTYAGIIPAGDTVEIEIDVLRREEWDREPLKTLTDLWPRKVFVESDGTALATVTVWPSPTSAPTLILAGPEPILTPETLDTELIFPDGGYEEDWRLNLAVRLCRPYGFAISPDLRDDARAATAVIRRINDSGPPIQRGTSPGGGYDIRSNQTR